MSLARHDGVLFGGGCNLDGWFQMSCGSYPGGASNGTGQAQNLHAFGFGTVTASARKA